MVKRATRRFWREGRRMPGYSMVDFLHGYAYAKWPYRYIGWAKGDRKVPVLLLPLVGLVAKLFLGKAAGRGPAAKQAFADHYHGKVVPTRAAEQLVTLEVDIELRGLEKIIPYATAQDILLQDPDHIVVLDCPCRSGVENPCLPLDVCLIIGEPFASFVLEHHPNRSRRIAQSEAVDILRAERDRGHVHHAFFKDAMLGRFYAICNCCSCCCGAMRAFRNGTPMLASSGYVAEVDAERCESCGACVEICPFGALSMENDLALVDADRCMGCGVCVANCPQGALALVLEPSKGDPLVIRKLVGSDLSA